MTKMVIIIIACENKYLHLQIGACVVHVYAKLNTFAHLRKVCMCASLYIRMPNRRIMVTGRRISEFNKLINRVSSCFKMAIFDILM